MDNALAVCSVAEKVFRSWKIVKWLNIRYIGFSLKTGKKKWKKSDFSYLVLNFRYQMRSPIPWSKERQFY